MSRHRHHKRKLRQQLRRRPAAELTGEVAAGSPPTKLTVFAYDAEQLLEESVASVERLPSLLDRYPVTWVNVDGFSDSQLIHRLGELFHLHPLALEDAVHVHQHAKVEPYPDLLFIVSRMIDVARPGETEQLGIFLGPRFVITFQEAGGDTFDPLRERLRQKRGMLRSSGPDVLAYSLLDAAVDSYFPVVDACGDRIDDLDETVSNAAERETMRKVHDLRRELLLLRRAIRPHREAFNELVRDPHPLIADQTRLYLRDCYDHTVQLIDLIDVYRELCSDQRDYHLSLVSYRMNEVMKVLTVIATLFMPLSFVAGVYGMNFDTRQPWNMPELRWPLGYLFALSLMAAIAGGMLTYFQRKRWL